MMTTEYYTVTIRPPRKPHRKPRRRRIRPEAMGLLLAVICAVVCVAATVLVTDSQASAVGIVEPTPTHAAAPTINPATDASDLASDDEWAYFQGQVPAADPADLTILAQTVWGEARGVTSKARQAAVLWCIFNRIDDPRWPDTIAEVCIHSQFHGYDPSHPVEPELYELAFDVYSRYYREKAGDPDSGRVLPSEYVFFHGDGVENHFRIDYESTGEFWEWSLPSPYAEDYE